MKTIRQYSTVLHDNKDPKKTIADRAAICYKSEDDPRKGTPEEFFKKMAKHGHNSTFEMHALTVLITDNSDSNVTFSGAVTLFRKQEYKFLTFDSVVVRTSKGLSNGLLITGSVRGFREMIMMGGTKYSIGNVAVLAIDRKHPGLFFDLDYDAIPDASINLFQTEVFNSNYIARDCTDSDDTDINYDIMVEPDVDGVNNLVMVDSIFKRHRYMAIKFYTNRAVTHEIVRHRPCSFLQESQRYCRYDDDRFGNEVTFITPSAFYEDDSDEYRIWIEAMQYTETAYLKLLETSSPQAARTVLPNSCKTEIIVYCNIVEWEHIFAMRIPKAAELSMREGMNPVFDLMKEMWPGLVNKPMRSVGGN